MLGRQNWTKQTPSSLRGVQLAFSWRVYPLAISQCPTSNANVSNVRCPSSPPPHWLLSYFPSPICGTCVPSLSKGHSYTCTGLKHKHDSVPPWPALCCRDTLCLTVVSTALSGPQHLAYTSSPVHVYPTEEGRSCDQVGMNKIYPPDPGKSPVTTPPPPLLSVLLLLPVPRGQLFCCLCQRPTGSLQSQHPTCSQISTPRPLRIQAAFLPGPGLTLTPGARPAEHMCTSQTASPRTAPQSPPPHPGVYRTLSVPGPPAPLNLAAYLDICTHMCSFYTSPCSAKGFCSLWRRKCKVSIGHHHIQLCRVFTAQEHPLRGTVGVQMQPLSVHQALQPSADYTFPERVPFPGWPSVFHGP